MLKVALDDPQGRRLVLRAPRAGLAFWLRRLVLTAVVGSFVYFLVHTGRTDLNEILAGLVFIALLAMLLRSEVAEVRVTDGALEVRERGWLCWLLRRRTIELERGVTLEGGLPTQERRGGALGVRLTWHDGSVELAIDELDRRDELRRLVAVLADRLGVGLETVADDALTYQARLAPHLPPAAPDESGGYRTLGHVGALDTSTAAAFEPPAEVPPIRREALATELVELDPDRGRFAGRHAPRRLSLPRPSGRTVIGLLGASAACSAIGAGIAAISGGPVRDAAIGGALLPIALPVALIVGLAVGYAWLFLLALGLGFVLTVTRGPGPSRPGGLASLRPRSWSIDRETDRLSLGRLVPLRLPLRFARELVVRRLPNRPAEAELWLHLGPVWIRLARTHATVGHEPGALADALGGVACAIGRALDLPLRNAS